MHYGIHLPHFNPTMHHICGILLFGINLYGSAKMSYFTRLRHSFFFISCNECTYANTDRHTVVLNDRSGSTVPLQKEEYGLHLIETTPLRTSGQPTS